MSRSHVIAFALPALLVVAGCGRTQLPANPSPPKDRADLEARYGAIETGVHEPEVAAFLGKAGAALAGYSTQPVRRKPEGETGVVAAGETSKFWASDDGAGAIHVVFRPDGRARLIELLRITPMGPPPRPPAALDGGSGRTG